MLFTIIILSVLSWILFVVGLSLSKNNWQACNLLLFWIICIVLLWCSTNYSKDEGYKQGQVDALSGKMTIKKVVTSMPATEKIEFVDIEQK